VSPTTRQIRDLPRRILRFVRDHDLARPGERILVAISGGADSAALLAALHRIHAELGISLVAAHLNHGLRDDADRDEQAARALAAHLDVPLVAGRLETLAGAGDSLEQAARDERYRFLHATSADAAADRIAVGHTLDDRAETFLLNLFRGAGPRGLAAPRPARGDGVIRPLLDERRAVVRAFAEQSGLAIVEDRSNHDRRFARNRVRLDLLPAVVEAFSDGVVQRIASAARILDEEDRLLEDLADATLESLRRPGPGVLLEARGLASHIPALAARVLRAAIAEAKGDLRRVTEAHIRDGLRLARSDSRGREIMLPGDIRVVRDGDVLAVVPTSAEGPAAEYEVPADAEGHHLLGHGIVLEVARAAAEDRPATASVVFLRPDAAADLVLRPRRPGDRIRLLGGPGTRKISDLFIDCKVPRSQREWRPLLAEATGSQVFWVPGLRVGEGPWAEPGDDALRLSVRFASPEVADPR